MLAHRMQCRLPAIVRCVSHPSAHVRALSTSVLHAVMQSSGSIKSNLTSYKYIKGDVEKCLTWEAHTRLATSQSIEFVDKTAKELGCCTLSH